MSGGNCRAHMTSRWEIISCANSSTHSLCQVPFALTETTPFSPAQDQTFNEADVDLSFGRGPNGEPPYMIDPLRAAEDYIDGNGGVAEREMSTPRQI
jgi:hypothetical protein